MPATSFTLLIGYAPAPPEVVDAVQRIDVECSTDIASVCRLRLGIAQSLRGDWTILEHDLFRPLLPLSLRIANGTGLPEAIFNGYITHLEANYAEEPANSTLEITALDATHLMNLQEKVMPWPNMPDSVIAAAIFGQYGLIPRVEPTSPQLIEPEGTTTQRGTDIRFLRQIAWRNGFECYIQPEPLSGVDQAYFQPRSSPFGVPQAVINVNMGPETNVDGFRVRYAMTQPTSAIAGGIDTATKAPQPALAPVSLQVPWGLEPTLLQVAPPPMLRPAGTGRMTIGELQPAIQAIVDESSWAVEAEGTVANNAGVLRPGGIINVRGAGRVFSGSYYATRITHAIDRDGMYTQRFHARRNAVGMTGAELYVSL